MNRLETAYAGQLALRQRAGEVCWWAFEPITLRLAPRTSYTPDFLVLLADGTIECVEVKALWSDGRVGYRDDARVKLKLAAQWFGALFRFRAVAGRIRRGQADWPLEEVLP